MRIFQRHTLMLLIAATALALIASGDAYELKKEIKLSGDLIRSDELGNVFLIKDDKLTKYDSKGEKIHVYSNLYAGHITSVDTHDPFKILLFYQAFGHIEFLDHSLSLSSSSIDLNELNLGLATLACTSYRGAFWVYDPMNFELVRIDQSLKVSESSGNLQQITGFTLNPNYMLERDNSLYLNDPAIGVLMFDKYGSYYKTIPLKGLSTFQVFDRKIIYVQEDKINIYDTQINEISTAALPGQGSKSVSVCLSIKPQMLYMLGNERLYFYQIN